MLVISLNITNTSKLAGTEVVQVYAGENKPTVERPVRELKAFKKIFLKPGETKRVDIELYESDLGYYNDKEHQWITNKGKYTFWIGTSSRNLLKKVEYNL